MAQTLETPLGLVTLRRSLDSDLVDFRELRLEALRNWRKEKGRERGVESDVILPRDLLIELANQNPKSPEALGVEISAFPGRLEKFLADVLAVLVKRNTSLPQRPARRRRPR